MREIRTSGSEGGGTEPNRSSLPLSRRFAQESIAPCEDCLAERDAAVVRRHSLMPDDGESGRLEARYDSGGKHGILETASA